MLNFLRTRWHKVLLDLWANKARTFMVVFAVAVGVFAVGFMSSAYNILIRELRSDYVSLNSASATLFTDPFDERLVRSIEKLPEVGVAEGRRSLGVRFQSPSGEWRTLNLTALPDDPLEIDRLYPLEGNWPPGRQELIVERQSLAFLGWEIGDEMVLELPDGSQKEIVIGGTAFFNAVPSAEIINAAFGFVSLDTMERYGQGGFYSEIRFRVAEQADNRAHIDRVAEAVREKLENSGRTVYAVATPPPGEHWAEEIIATMILLFLIFGGLILFLSSFLVINTISALITQQIQQIGVMKLVGAQRAQIIWMYLTMVFLYCTMALLIAIPSSIWFGRWAAQMSADLLNTTIDNNGISPFVLLLQAAIGIVIPLGAALIPIFGGVKITTQKALSSIGIDGGNVGDGLVDRLFLFVQRFLPVQRPFVISLRNTIRRKSRMILTLIILTMGTALFISVLTVRSSITQTFDSFMRYHPFEVSVRFKRPYRMPQLSDTADQFTEIEQLEGWLQLGTRRIRPNDTESGGVTLVGLPPDSRFVDPEPRDGRWLHGDDRGVIVLNSQFMSEEPDLEIGGPVTLSVDGEEHIFEIVGVVHGLENDRIYVPYAELTVLTGRVGQVNALNIYAAAETAEAQNSLANRLIDRFNRNGFEIAGSSTFMGQIDELNQRFQIVVGFLIIMAVLLALVGGLGLATTMSINILERIREIGVLRAIGASNTAVQRIVLTEGLMIGLASWVLGSLISIPLSRTLSETVGMALLQIPLDFSYSTVGLIAWFFAVLLLAVVSCLGPAQSAARLTIREVLAYE